MPRKTLALIAFALAFSGAVQALISPPLNWLVLHPFALVPGFWALTKLEGRRRILGAVFMGVCANTAIFYWITHTVRNFSNLPTALAIGVLLLFAIAYGGGYMALFAWGLPRVRRVAGPAWPVAVAALFVGCEFLNPQLFPYYQGVAFYQQPSFFLATGLFGVPGITLQVVLWNLLLLALLERRTEAPGHALSNRAWGANAGVAALLLVVSLGYSQYRLGLIEAAEAEAETVTVALIQTNQTVQKRRMMMAKSRTAIIDDYVALSWKAVEANPEVDVLIWPEGAMRGDPNARVNWRARKFVEDTGKEVWTGGTSAEKQVDGSIAFFNSAFRMHGSGTVDPAYHKNILLPFGEFMPFEDVLPFLKKIQGVGDFTRGEELTIFSALEQPSVRFCFLICYEAIRHEYVRGAVREGVDLLVNITYDAWFGDTSCPSQHLMLSAIQSAEYGVPLVRSATTGISATVDARGMLRKQTKVFARDVLVDEVKLVNLPTPYARFGDWLAWLCILGSGGLLLRSRTGGKKAA